MRLQIEKITIQGKISGGATEPFPLWAINVLCWLDWETPPRRLTSCVGEGRTYDEALRASLLAVFDLGFKSGQELIADRLL